MQDITNLGGSGGSAESVPSRNGTYKKGPKRRHASATSSNRSSSIDRSKYEHQTDGRRNLAVALRKAANNRDLAANWSDVRHNYKKLCGHNLTTEELNQIAGVVGKTRLELFHHELSGFLEVIEPHGNVVRPILSHSAAAMSPESQISQSLPASVPPSPTAQPMNSSNVMDASSIASDVSPIPNAYTSDASSPDDSFESVNSPEVVNSAIDSGLEPTLVSKEGLFCETSMTQGGMEERHVSMLLNAAIFDPEGDDSIDGSSTLRDSTIIAAGDASNIHLKPAILSEFGEIFKSEDVKNSRDVEYDFKVGDVLSKDPSCIYKVETGRQIPLVLTPQKKETHLDVDEEAVLNEIQELKEVKDTHRKEIETLRKLTQELEEVAVKQAVENLKFAQKPEVLDDTDSTSAVSTTMKPPATFAMTIGGSPRFEIAATKTAKPDCANDITYSRSHSRDVEINEEYSQVDDSSPVLPLRERQPTWEKNLILAESPCDSESEIPEVVEFLSQCAAPEKLISVADDKCDENELFSSLKPLKVVGSLSRSSEMPQIEMPLDEGVIVPDLDKSLRADKTKKEKAKEERRLARIHDRNRRMFNCCSVL